MKIVIKSYPGHKGRPGKVGGSMPKSGGGEDKFGNPKGEMSADQKRAIESEKLPKGNLSANAQADINRLIQEGKITPSRPSTMDNFPNLPSGWEKAARGGSGGTRKVFSSKDGKYGYSLFANKNAGKYDVEINRWAKLKNSKDVYASMKTKTVTFNNEGSVYDFQDQLENGKIQFDNLK